MLNKLLSTNNDWAGLILRVTLGLMIFPHGAQKLLGWFGGHGFSGTMTFFTGAMGIPYIFALLAIIAESFGALALIIGFATRIAALGVGSTIVVAALVIYSKHGYFFMNWFGKQAGEGIEYHLLVIGMALALMLAGGGKWSLDRLLTQKIAN